MTPLSPGSSTTGDGAEARVITLASATRRASSQGDAAPQRRRRLRPRVHRGAGPGLLPRRASGRPSRSYADEHDLELVDEYCDFHSGWRTADSRPGFQRLMSRRDAEQRFDVVLVFHTSRFARNQVEARRYKSCCATELGIDVVSVTQPIGDDLDDPSSFLAESIHEMFDEYYSVSLSFWTHAGPCARRPVRGTSSASLPWGYVTRPDDSDRGARPGTRAARARHVRALRDRPGVRPHARRVAQRAGRPHDPRAARSRKDTVREMLVNASYCGYVSGLRDQSREIRGRHEPIVAGGAVRPRAGGALASARASLKPGRPSTSTCCASSLYCERCGARMHGTAARGRTCAATTARRAATATPCDQPLVHGRAARGSSSSDWLRDFQPDDELRERDPRRRSRDATHDADTDGTTPPRAHRRARTPARPLRPGRPHRSRSTSCAAKRSTQELDTPRRRPDRPAPRPSRRACLTTSPASGSSSRSPAERRKLLAPALRARSGITTSAIVAVRRSPAFAPSSKPLRTTTAPQQVRCQRAGATGLEPATSGVTGRRSNQLSYAPERIGTASVAVARGPGRRHLESIAPCRSRRRRRSSPIRSPGCTTTCASSGRPRCPSRPVSRTSTCAARAASRARRCRSCSTATSASGRCSPSASSTPT